MKSLLISTWSNQSRIALNLTLFNRYPFHEDVDKLVGDFTSVLLLDIDCAEYGNYEDLCLNIQNTLAEAMEHKLYEGIQVIRDLARIKGMVNQPVMPIVFTSMLFGEEKNSNYKIGSQEYTSTQTTQVYLDHQANDMDGNLNLTWDYVSDLFDEEIIRKMFKQYIDNIKSIIKGNIFFEEELSDVDSEIIEQYNMTDTRKAEITLIDLFQETVKKYPNNPAIIDKETIITINEQISNFAQSYPANSITASIEAPLLINRYRFVSCSCFSCFCKKA